MNATALSSLRHDLRNPIGQVIGYTEMLIEDAEGVAPDLVADLERVRAAGRTLLDLVDGRLTADALGSAPVTFSRIAPKSPSPSPSPSLASMNAAGATAPLPAPQGRILIVDDNAENRDVLARRLERQGHSVVAVPGGAEALDALAASHFDLVLLDIMMPEMDGYTVLGRIKGDADLNSIPVIMISALDEMDSVVRCIELGAADYLPKPFNPTLLRARIGACLREKRAHDRGVELFAALESNYKKLQQLEDLRDSLTSMIVHDLRTPLTSLLTGLQTVAVAGELNPMQHEMLGIALDGGKTLLDMINDLLDIDKMEDGSLQLDVAAIDPAVLVERSVAQVAMLASSKQITLETDVAPGLTAFLGDEDKLRRTLVNLLGNALKFTPISGRVTVSVRSDADAIVFAVRDTGEGIPKEAFGRIFEKFGQVETRKAGRKMSTGLGLTFCKMAVEAHGGTIGVDSELGHGSVFSFSIPRKGPAPTE